MNCLTTTKRGTRNFPPYCKIKMCHHHMKYAKKINIKCAWQQQGVFHIDFCINVCGLLLSAVTKCYFRPSSPNLIVGQYPSFSYTWKQNTSSWLWSSKEGKSTFHIDCIVMSYFSMYFFKYYHSRRPWDSSDGIITRLQAGLSGVWILAGGRDFPLFFFLKDPQQFRHPNSLLFNEYQWPFPRG
jgi:hypothetical protein